MMKHKVSELEGALLDAAVGFAELGVWGHDERGRVMAPPYSTSPALAVPIIERERITLVASTGQDGVDPLEWSASVGPYSHYIDELLPLSSRGPTPLIAAMRAYVASKLGEEVELP
jgi:uncharacterized protein DUF2591